MRKKILYCENNVDGTVGGSYYSLLFLVKGLDKKKYEPTVIFYKDNEVIPEFRSLGIETHIFNKPNPVIFRKHVFSPFQKLINFLKRLIIPALKYSFYLKQNNIHLVHLNNSLLYNHDWMLAAKLARIKCITHERGINQRYSFFSKFFGRRLSKVICISEAVKSNMIQKGVELPNLDVIYNGLNPIEITVKINKTELLKMHGIDRKGPVIGIIGNIKEWKGQDVVIRAIKFIKEKFPFVKCFIVGQASVEDKYYEAKLIKLMSSLELSKNVIFTGYKKNVADYINIMDIVIHASVLPEPFGRVLLEAMAMKKPVIGSRDGAVPEIIDNGKTGFTFTPGDAQELAHYLEILLSHQEKASRFGELGYARLINKFHILKNIESTQDLYQSILDNEN